MGLIKSLANRNNPLAEPKAQVEYLNSGLFLDGELPTFKQTLKENKLHPLKPGRLEILQMNLGYQCNQTCKHCHVDAGPDRKEIMTRETMERCLEIIQSHEIPSIDLTGGAPEMNPHFQWFIEAARPHVQEIIVRSNLTILTANEHYRHYPEFFAKNRVRVISSLPFYNADKTDRQRGNGVFDRSIDALRTLNNLGYGQAESGLILDLVYNPVGAFLPAAQDALERSYKDALWNDHGILFNALFCITNLPISRYLEYLVKTDNYEDYMDKLVDAFNSAAVEGVMCKNTLSIGWDGRLFDCDFNQMLDLPLAESHPKHVNDFDLKSLLDRQIAIGQHCYGCTAGAGSSCQGTLV